jgi:hypothetical protein
VIALEGTGPAFIRELRRRVALLAAEQDEGPLQVTDRHLHAALAELRHGGGELTQALLGARPPRSADGSAGTGLGR